MPRKPKVTEPKVRIIRVRLSEREYQQLLKAAAATGRRVSEILRFALREYLSRRGSQKEENP